MISLSKKHLPEMLLRLETDIDRMLRRPKGETVSFEPASHHSSCLL